MSVGNAEMNRHSKEDDTSPHIQDQTRIPVIKGITLCVEKKVSQHCLRPNK